MKTAEEWAFETGSFSMMGRVEYINFIEDVQRDALSSPLASVADQEALEMPKSIAMNERIRGDQLHDQLLKMREKWLEARRHLRAANKGAERNAVAIGLCSARAHSLDTFAKRHRDREERKHETIVWNWLLMSDDDLSTKIDSDDPIVVAACRRLLKAMLGTRILKL